MSDVGPFVSRQVAADPVTLIAATAVVSLITVAAATLPARRISRISPAAALR